jgi:hypothetical protein
MFCARLACVWLPCLQETEQRINSGLMPEFVVDVSEVRPVPHNSAAAFFLAANVRCVVKSVSHPMLGLALHSVQAAREFVYSCLRKRAEQRPTAWQLRRSPWLKVRGFTVLRVLGGKARGKVERLCTDKNGE